MSTALNEDYLPVPAPYPVLGLPASVLEVGESVRQGRSLVVAVPVANRGGAGAPDLRVTLCSESDWVATPSAPTLIPAGRTALINVTLNPPPTVPIGAFTVRLRAQAPNAVFDQEGVVEIEGVLIRDIALVADPPEVRLGRAKVSDQAVQASLVAVRNDALPARPRIVGCTPASEFAHAVAAVVRDGGRIEVNVHTANLQLTGSRQRSWPWRRRRREGAHRVELVIADEDKDVREVRVPVSLTLTDVPRLRCPAAQEEEAPDTTGKFTVPIDNVGGEPLHVRIHTDSRWVTPSSQSTVIRPGGQRKIALSYDLASVDQVRPQATLEVESDENDHPSSVRRMQVLIRRLWPELEVGVDPPQVGVLQGRTAPVTLRLMNRGPGVAYVSVADPPAWLLLGKTSARVGPGRMERIRSRVVAVDREPGSLAGKLTVEYNGPPRDGASKPQVSRLAIPVSANVTARTRRRSASWVLAVLLPLAGLLALAAMPERRDFIWHVLTRQDTAEPANPSSPAARAVPPPSTAPAPNVAPGDLTLEAADAELHGELQIERRTSGSNIGSWGKATDWVSWTINAPRPAKYHVTVQCAAKAGPSQFVVELDGGTTLGGTAPQTESWDGFVPVTLGTVELKTAGRHVLTVRPRDAGTWRAINLLSVRLVRTAGP